jgi:hypothetical protein
MGWETFASWGERCFLCWGLVGGTIDLAVYDGVGLVLPMDQA